MLLHGAVKSRYLGEQEEVLAAGSCAAFDERTGRGLSEAGRSELTNDYATACENENGCLHSAFCFAEFCLHSLYTRTWICPLLRPRSSFCQEESDNRTWFDCASRAMALHLWLASKVRSERAVCDAVQLTLLRPVYPK
jgi:hypothetical protein